MVSGMYEVHLRAAVSFHVLVCNDYLLRSGRVKLIHYAAAVLAALVESVG